MGIKIIFFLFLYENIYCGYSLEAPCQGASNEYTQHVFMEKKISGPSCSKRMTLLVNDSLKF